jgi:hypothetical protein
VSSEYVDEIARRIKENIKGTVLFQVVESIEVRCKTSDRDDVCIELSRAGMNVTARHPLTPGKMDLKKIIITGTRIVESEKVPA